MIYQIVDSEEALVQLEAMQQTDEDAAVSDPAPDATALYLNEQADLARRVC